MHAWSHISIRKRKWLLVGLLILLVLILPSAGQEPIHASVALAQALDGWSEPVLLSTNTDRSWFADVIADGQGRVHVVWDSFTTPRSFDEEALNLTMYAVRAPDGVWSEPNDIATGMGTEVSRPAITAGGAGLLHIASRPSGIVRYSQADSDDAYSAQGWCVYPRRLSGSNATYVPAIAMDSRGRIHVVWAEQVAVTLSEEEIFQGGRFFVLSDIFYRQSGDGGATWSTPLNLSRTPNVGSGRVQIKVDAQDGIHVTWDEGWDRNAQGDFAGSSSVCGMHVRSLDGGQTWSAPQVFDMPRALSVQLSDAYSSYETGLRHLMGQIDRGSPRYSEALVCQNRLVENLSQAQERGDSEVLAARRAAIIAQLDDLALSVVGTSFGELCALDVPAAEEGSAGEPLMPPDNSQMTLGLDNDQGVLLVWRSAELGRIYYAWSEDRGTTWSGVEHVPGIYVRPSQTVFDAYDTATDSLGHIHLVLVATTTSPEVRGASSLVGVYHLRWDGKSWSEPDLIAYYPGSSMPEYPRIAVGQGNHLHLVWFVRSEGGSEFMRVWYSELEIDAPPEEPDPTPTPTPTPTATPEPTPMSTVTPFPTLGPGGSGMPEGLYTEQDDLGRLVLALSPVLLLVMIVSAVRRLWTITMR